MLFIYLFIVLSSVLLAASPGKEAKRRGGSRSRLITRDEGARHAARRVKASGGAHAPPSQRIQRNCPDTFFVFYSADAAGVADKQKMAAAFCDKLMAYDVEPEDWRKLDVSVGEPAEGDFCDNSIKTYKYNPISWLPKSLFEQMRRLANQFFLVMGILMAIGTLRRGGPG